MGKQGLLVLLLAATCISKGALLAAAAKQVHRTDTAAGTTPLAISALHAQHMSADRKLLGVQAAAAADDNIRKKQSGGGGGGSGFYTGGRNGGWGRSGGLW